MRTLRKYLYGNDIKHLQYFLGIKPDGNFGNDTEKAVKERQAKDGLVADGYVGKNTQAKWGLYDFKVDIFDKSQVWFAGYPYKAKVKTPKHLKQWAEEEQADIVYNLAFFNSVGTGSDQYGVIKGRTLTYLKAKGIDVGYGGTGQRIDIDANNSCAGYIVAIDSGVPQPVSSWGYRPRNANGILKDGRYFHIQSVYTATEKQIRDFMLNNYAVSLMLIQDSGGSVGCYKAGTLFAPEPEGKDGRPVASVVCVRLNKQKEKDNICPTCGQVIK